MKKETTNTFNKGMVKDLHPLTTPDNILTDALNATLITYNGNEGVLQNDMGNVKIDAELPAGYVPVGMKEHGGIIYVAAYNPETGKGQVGSFPSPKQVIKDVEWSVNSDEGNLASISIEPVVYKDNTYLIQNEIIKKELFGANNGEARVFHPGDKFIINIPSITRARLKGYIDEGTLDIELGVIKNDGGIEIMKTWTKGTDGDFISCINITDTSAQDYISPQDAIKDPSIVQVFDASSSGKLILIITLHTLDTFNVIRTYSLVEEGNDKKIRVTFKGEAEKDGEHLDSTDSNSKLQIGKNVSSDQPSSTLYLTEDEGPNSITIYPALSFGYIERMKKNITINFDKIRKNKDDFGEWRFYVTETYVKIGWSYDFYNLEGDKEIEYIKMYFHKLEDGYPQTAEARRNVKSVVFQKESYNGNFEDYINIQDTGLTYMNIYIVEIVKKLTNESESIIAFKMLYLSPLYNSQYNGFYKNNSIGQQDEGQNNNQNEILEYTQIGNETSDLIFTTKYDTKLTKSSVQIKNPGDPGLGSEINVSDAPEYTKVMTKQEYEALQDKNYITRINNDYSTSLTITGEIKNLNDDIIGIPKSTIINTALNRFTLGTPTKDDVRQFIPNTTTINFDNIDSYNRTVGVQISNPIISGNTLSVESITSGDSRLLQGIVTKLTHDAWPAYGLVPLCTANYKPETYNKLAPYWNFKKALCISGDEDEAKTIFYNSNLHENGVVDGGIDAGAGFDDEGLYAAANAMGKPMTNIFGGINGDQSELTFYGTMLTNAGGDNGFDFDGPTLIDQDDHYLIACWKFNDGDTRFVNLMSRKYWSADPDHPFATRFNKWPRVDVMLRSILSQIFVVGWVTKEADYISPNVNYYNYQEGQLKLHIPLQYDDPNSDNDVLKDIMTSTDENHQDQTLTSILSSVWKYRDGKIHLTNDQNDPGYALVNLIPKVNIRVHSAGDEVKIEIPNMYNMDMAIANYLNAAYVRDTSQDSVYDPKTIYTASINSNNINENINVEIHDDGIFEWKETPEVTEVTGDLTIRRWDYNLGYNDTPNTITFKDFGTHFMTYAALNDLNELPEGKTNEIIANLNGADNVNGKWTNAAPDHAPNLQINILYSEQVSPLVRNPLYPLF